MPHKWLARPVETFKKYEPGNPGRPRYIPLEPMPFNTHARVPGSVLMVVEHFTTDDVPRHNRRTVKPMVYIVRAYAFMARNIKAGRRAEARNDPFRVVGALERPENAARTWKTHRKS